MHALSKEVDEPAPTRVSYAKSVDASNKPIVVGGGVSFAQALVRATLVDEFQLAVHSIALGRGKPLCFDAMPRPRAE